MKKSEQKELENKTEEKVAKEEPLNNQKVVEHFEYESEYLKKIEDSRLEFLAYYKKQNFIKWIVGAAAFALIVFAFIGLPNIGKDSSGNQASWVLPVMIVTLALSLVAIFMYSSFLKRKISKRMKVYFDGYYENVNKYVFEQDGFKEHTIQTPSKIEPIVFTENNMYKDVIDVGSRGLTDFEFEGIHMMVCDCAAQIKTDKRMKPVFVGKYMVSPCAYGEADPIVIYLKGDKRALPPTNMEGLAGVYEDDNVVIYSNNKKWNKVFTNKLIKNLKSIKSGEQLVDVAISLHSGKAYFCLGYDDPLIVLPLEHAYDPNPYMEFKKEMIEFVKMAKELN